MSYQVQGSFEIPEPHQLMNTWNLISSPRRIIRGDEDYKRFTLYRHDDAVQGGLKLIGALYAIDRRDAWHAFFNKGLIDQAKEYEIF